MFRLQNLHFHPLIAYNVRAFDLSHLSALQSDDSQTGKRGNLNLMFYC